MQTLFDACLKAAIAESEINAGNAEYPDGH
jgi:hypothetical protein